MKATRRRPRLPRRSVLVSPSPPSRPSLVPAAASRPSFGGVSRWERRFTPGLRRAALFSFTHAFAASVQPAMPDKPQF